MRHEQNRCHCHASRSHDNARRAHFVAVVLASCHARRLRLPTGDAEDGFSVKAALGYRLEQGAGASRRFVCVAPSLSPAGFYRLRPAFPGRNDNGVLQANWRSASVPGFAAQQTEVDPLLQSAPTPFNVDKTLPHLAEADRCFFDDAPPGS
jgi:hypothetical protein